MTVFIYSAYVRCKLVHSLGSEQYVLSGEFIMEAFCFVLGDYDQPAKIFQDEVTYFINLDVGNGICISYLRRLSFIKFW